MNSSNKISPGCIGLMPFLLMTGSPSVIIGDFDFIRSVSLPEKTNPPLIVDPDAVLPDPIRVQHLRWGGFFVFIAFKPERSYFDRSIVSINRSASTSVFNLEIFFFIAPHAWTAS
jgi:hypothetical protein